MAGIDRHIGFHAMKKAACNAIFGRLKAQFS